MRRRRSECARAVREAREHRRHVAEARERELREHGRTHVREQCASAPTPRCAQYDAAEAREEHGRAGGRRASPHSLASMLRRVEDPRR
jgi:hypothetical protein